MVVGAEMARPISPTGGTPVGRIPPVVSGTAGLCRQPLGKVVAEDPGRAVAEVIWRNLLPASSAPEAAPGSGMVVGAEVARPHLPTGGPPIGRIPPAAPGTAGRCRQPLGRVLADDPGRAVRGMGWWVVTRVPAEPFFRLTTALSGTASSDIITVTELNKDNPWEKQETKSKRHIKTWNLINENIFDRK